MHEDVCNVASILNSMYKEMKHFSSLLKDTWSAYHTLRLNVHAIHSIYPNLLQKLLQNECALEHPNKKLKIHYVLRSCSANQSLLLENSRTKSINEIVHDEYERFLGIPVLADYDPHSCSIKFRKSKSEKITPYYFLKLHIMYSQFQLRRFLPKELSTMQVWLFRRIDVL